MPQTKPIVSIENVVASATVDQKMDLNDITKKFPDVEYHPDQFPGLVFRLKSPKTATLIFTSGKMVCTGAKSEQMSKNAVKTVVEKLRKGNDQSEKKCSGNNSKYCCIDKSRWKNSSRTSSENITKKHVRT